jgi:hypothetical protein
MVAWQGLMYVQDRIIKLGAVTRETGEGLWQAWRLYDGYELLGDFTTPEEAQAAVEGACQEYVSRRPD